VRISPYLTSVNPTLDRLAAATDCGQAHWAGTGPEGATCGQCAFLGYWQKSYNEAGDTVNTKKSAGCAEFYRLTGRHGAPVGRAALACRHFRALES
jgi:hypothetical protein